MEITKPNAFLTQISLYLKNNNPESAYTLSKDFVGKFPAEMSSHYLLALSALRSGRLEEAKLEGRKAFNMAQSTEDMITCALVSGMAYYELKEYAKGYEILSLMERKGKTAELEKMLVIFSLALNSPNDAARHEEELFRLNAAAARNLLARAVDSLSRSG
jgi:tetratricopeptide (TPR) repeat protein